jgi:hypothetical protein
MRARKVNVNVTMVVNRHGTREFLATAVYLDGAILRKRSARSPESADIAAYRAKMSLLDALEDQGIDPECVAAERELTRERESR